jgi:hypothetical protein
MKMKLLLAGVVCVLLVGACGGREYAASTEMAADMAEVNYEPVQRGRQALAYDEAGKMAGVPAEASSAQGGGGGIGGLDMLAQSKPDRYLIKNATVIVETEDARAATEQLTAALAQVDGYVSDLHETVNAFGKRTVVMQIRIPSDRFDQSMLQVETLGKVLNKQVNTQDVTEQYVDTEARSRNLKRTEERLLEHLSRAGVLEEVLRVEKELTRIREEIERLEGQLRFLADRVGYSTISITLQEAARSEPITPAESFSTGKVFTEAIRSLVGFAQRIWTRIIWILVWAPVWLVPVAVGYFAYRQWRKQKAA